MRKIVVLLLFVLMLGALPITAHGAAVEVFITISSESVSYTPEGYMPSATANAYVGDIKYQVTDTATGDEVGLPITEIGTYTVKAYMEETNFHTASSALATVTVSPATAYLSVPKPIVAHTAMENPVQYTIEPAWAAEYVKVKVNYRAISSLTDKGTAIEVPKDMGLYMVYMEAESSSTKVKCAGKYLVYEIAESDGSVLSPSSALRSVPVSFSAAVENVNTTYNGKGVVSGYTLNVAGVESRIMYRLLSADGAASPYTDTPPSEPGDYAADCFVLDTVVGSGRIVIAKKQVDIIMEDCVFSYRPEGVTVPEAKRTPEGIELKYTAYSYTDGIIGQEVSQPLVKCGTYLIKVCPVDIAYYAYTTEYCILTIKKADPVIKGENTVWVADGKEKEIGYSISPGFASYTVSYYCLKEGGDVKLLSAPPKDPGNYYAVIAVTGDERLNSATAVYGLRIDSPDSTNRAVAGRILKYLCVIFVVVSVFVACFQIYWTKRYQRR